MANYYTKVSVLFPAGSSSTSGTATTSDMLLVLLLRRVHVSVRPCKLAFKGRQVFPHVFGQVLRIQEGCPCPRRQLGPGHSRCAKRFNRPCWLSHCGTPGGRQARWVAASPILFRLPHLLVGFDVATDTPPHIADRRWGRRLSVVAHHTGSRDLGRNARPGRIELSHGPAQRAVLASQVLIQLRFAPMGMCLKTPCESRSVVFVHARNLRRLGANSGMPPARRRHVQGTPPVRRWHAGGTSEAQGSWHMDHCITRAVGAGRNGRLENDSRCLRHDGRSCRDRRRRAWTPP